GMDTSGEVDKENQRLEIVDENEEFVTPDTKPTIVVEKIPDDPVLNSPVVYSQGSVASSTATAGTSAEDTDEDDLEPDEGSEGTTKRGGVTCRKEKSLGLLCQRFIEAMKEATAAEGGNSVHLESVATKMKVEKRRIYDIVNVMEALDAMSKQNKSYYAWHGLNNLPKLMHDLQRESIDENLPSKIVQVEQAMCSFTDLSPGAKRKDLVGSMLDPVVLPSGPSTVSSSPLDSPFSSKSFRIATPTSMNSPSTSQNLRDPRGTKNSLAMLCRRFIMVLLANPQDRRRVSLDVASTVLIKDTETEGFDPPSRGRCRRLYDIANVLVAMGIIKKVHYLFGTKKIPLFIYSGPEPDESAILSDEKLEEMMVLPRKAIDDVIREKKIFGKRSKSEACLDDVMRQQRAGKMSRMSSPHDSPATTAWKMMALAEAAEKERLLLQYGSPNDNKRLTQSTSSLVVPPSTSTSSHAWSPSTHSIPTSPLALGAGQFVLPRAQPFALYRTLSDLSAIGSSSGPSFARSPRSSLQPVLSPLSAMNRLPPQFANLNQMIAAAAAAGQQQQQHHSSSPRQQMPARRVLAPMQPSITSPRAVGTGISPKKTPKHAIKYLLKSPAFKKEILEARGGETPEKEKVRIGTLEHRGNSRFQIVKKQPGTEELRRAFGVSNAFNTQGNSSFEAMRKQHGI
ncbi:efl-3, partial [Pristionchus pacificus]|uniref:E2F/DP family winged-helix DNA-binding domain-containing protein n=1 Tax=Pristionchus pacificus TaxID=54126 RepID=A0A8R1UFK9_PRIPA